MPIEELGRDYLCRYNAIRRHTIGTNFDNNQSNYIVKSTECLLMLQENDSNQSKNTKSIVNINENYDYKSFNANSDPVTKISSFTVQYNKSIEQLKQQPQVDISESIKNSFNSISLLHNQQEKNRLQEMISIDSKYLHPFPSTQTKEENKTKAFKQSNELNCSKKYIHQHRQYHNKYRAKQIRLLNGSEQQQQQTQQETSLAGRRASDGGSNISLFNQFYSLRNVYLKNTENDSQNQDTLNINNLGATLYQSRGSITSGIPIFSTSTQLAESSRPESPSLINNSSSACLSSEDDEMNLNSNNVMKLQRKTSRTRHEPYTELGSNNLAKNCRPVSPFTSRKREQSFSGSNSPSLHNFSDSFNKTHRGSEPNQLDLICTYRAHLERIYNQSINKANVSPNKELLMLQHENPSIDEKTQLQLQVQHQNLIHKFQHVI